MEGDVTRNIEEQLSAFLDGELPEAELALLVRRLEKDSEYRATLARYSMVGSVLRDEPIGIETAGFRESVMVAVADEAVAPAGPGRASKRVTGPFAGHRLAAMAASIVGIVVFGVSQMVNAPETEAEAAQLVASSAPSGEVESARFGNRQANTVGNERLTSYLVSHGEFSRGFHGTMVDSRALVQQASFQASVYE